MTCWLVGETKPEMMRETQRQRDTQGEIEKTKGDPWEVLSTLYTLKVKGT